jgi:hypothetical protein
MEAAQDVVGSSAGEQCGRGLFGGTVQREAMMKVNYDPATENPLSPPRVDKSATEARQGVISGRVLLVLVVSMVLTMVAFVAAAIVYGGA